MRFSFFIFLLFLASCRHGTHLPPYGKIEWRDPSGAEVVPAGHPVEREALAQAIEDTMVLWEAVYGPNVRRTIAGGYANRRYSSAPLYVVFQEWPFEHPGCPILALHCPDPHDKSCPEEDKTERRLCNGLYIPRERMVLVGYGPGWERRLGHELGHVILQKLGKDYSEESLKTHADKYGVPY